MMRRNLLGAALFYAALSLSLPVQAQLEGTDTLPGAACDREGAVRMTANAAGPGAYVLTCDGTEWRATINAELPTANEQVANKEYVDTAVAAGSLAVCTDDYASLCALETNRAGNDPDFIPGNIVNGVNILGVTGTFTAGGGGLSGPVDCPEIGDVCTAQGNIIFAGYHPVTHEHLFIPPTDQGTTHQWKTATGTNDINPDSFIDGKLNHANRGAGTFPAFAACEGLSFGGHSDWYLPARAELDYLYNIRPALVAKGNITNFQNAFYWSSTEFDTSNAWRQLFTDGTIGFANKTGAYRVRCVRR